MMHGFGGIQVIDAPSLAERTSIRLGGAAIAEVRLSRPEGFERLPGLLANIGGRVSFLGEGSNIIASDGRLPLVLVRQEPSIPPAVVGENGNEVYIRASAGTRLPALLAKAASLGLSGLEGLAGIPGSVGGGVAMNAGSFGVEIGSLVRSVELFSPKLGLLERPAADFVFAYRSCAPVESLAMRLGGQGEWFLISAVTLALTKAPQERVRESMRAVYAKKQASQPVTAKSAGCVFKNPAPDAPAGWLLEQAGMKGVAVGGMRFSTLHANFLINEGGGTSEQALELIEKAKEKVLAHSGHTLALEVRLWP